MIKQLFTYIFLIFFTTSVVAEELFMKCGKATYKYVSEPSGDIIFVKTKRTKNKYSKWCSPGMHGAKLVEGHSRIIKNSKGICMVAKVVYENGYEITSSTSVTDFVTLTRTIEGFHNKETEKRKKSLKCKKKKK